MGDCFTDKACLVEIEALAISFILSTILIAGDAETTSVLIRKLLRRQIVLVIEAILQRFKVFDLA